MLSASQPFSPLLLKMARKEGLARKAILFPRTRQLNPEGQDGGDDLQDKALCLSPSAVPNENADFPIIPNFQNPTSNIIDEKFVLPYDEKRPGKIQNTKKENRASFGGERFASPLRFLYIPLLLPRQSPQNAFRNPSKASGSIFLPSDHTTPPKMLVFDKTEKPCPKRRS